MTIKLRLVIPIFCFMPLGACFFPGPSFDDEQEGELWCITPIQENETVVIQGSSCLVDHLSKMASPITVISAGKVRSTSFPSFLEHRKIEEGYVFSPKDKDLPIIEFLRKPETVDTIKEYQIRYIIFVSGRAYEEPMPEPYSAEDWQAAFIGSYREEKATYSALVVDAKNALVSGSILQVSKGTNIIIPLLITFSDPDPAESACEAIASSVAKILKGECRVISP